MTVDCNVRGDRCTCEHLLQPRGTDTRRTRFRRGFPPGSAVPSRSNHVLCFWNGWDGTAFALQPCAPPGHQTSRTGVTNWHAHGPHPPLRCNWTATQPSQASLWCTPHPRPVLEASFTQHRLDLAGEAAAAVRRQLSRRLTNRNVAQSHRQTELLNRLQSHMAAAVQLNGMHSCAGEQGGLAIRADT